MSLLRIFDEATHSHSFFCNLQLCALLSTREREPPQEGSKYLMKRNVSRVCGGLDRHQNYILGRDLWKSR